MQTIVGILTFMNRKNFMLNRVEHERSFITSGPVSEVTFLYLMPDRAQGLIKH